MPARIAFENFVGKELRQGQYPGVSETSTSPNGCYNSDKSKGSVPLTIKYEKNSCLQRTKIREAIEALQKEINTAQDTQFQIKEGIDWTRLHKLREAATFTVMSTRHLSDQERNALALELMSFRIKYFFLSKAQVMLKLEGMEIEVLRNLLHCSTTYLPFGQRQQSTQFVLSQVTAIGSNWYRIEVRYAPIGSMPFIPLQIAKSSIIPLLENEVAVIDSDLGFALINAFSASKFEFQTIVNEDNVNITMLTFWIPHEVKQNFPCPFSVKDRRGNNIVCTIEHCGNILPQTGAPGEPPRHETKGEHWRRIGEKCNPSFKNRLTVIAPVSTQNASQKRRFGLLKDSAVDLQTQQVSYTYSEETYPWILFLESIPVRDTLDIFLTHFSHFEAVNSAKGEFCKQNFLRFEQVSKFTRIMMFEIPSGRQCQINRVDGLESSLYLTKVDALQIYPFKACYLVMLVPPHFDFSAMLTADTKVEAIAAWKFSTFDNSGTNGKTTAVPSTSSTQHQPLTKDKRTDHGAKLPRTPSVPPSSKKEIDQLPAYAALGTTPPPTPPSQQVNPYQNSPPLTDAVAGASVHDTAKSNAERSSSQGELKGAQRACKVPEGQLTPGDARTDPPTVSPTIPWTNLPASHPAGTGEQPITDMVVDQDHHGNNIRKIEEEDKEMLPPQPAHLSTPLKKPPTCEGEALSSQKTSLQELKSTCGEGKGGFASKGRLSNEPSDPVITPSSPPGVSPPSQNDNAKPDNSDPIVLTLPSQCQPPDTASKAPIGNDHLPEKQSLLPDDSVVVEIGTDPPGIATPTKTKSSQASSLHQGEALPPIQAALKRSSVLPANDKTRVCIDITGEDDHTEQIDLTQPSFERETQSQSQQFRFASLSPFAESSRKWFPTLDATVIAALANKAQDIAIHCGHMSSMNTALYLLSRGPWIPTHVSIHVRQAALAAVGVGWSWVHQVPTVFPFTCFDACLSLATLSTIPPNSTTQNDAVYELYSIVCANLSQSTRSFLFSRFVLQCQACLQSSAIPIDTFTATIKPNTGIDELCDSLVPIWNTDELTECQACSCLDAAKAKWKCGKFGPLIIVRIKVPPGCSFPKLEEERLPLGHKFMFQEREYEIQCLIATTRLDFDSQLIVLHTSQPGMISMYDHNNGIRVVDSKHVSGKLLISGLVILPVKSPKAILMTKQLSEAAGGGEVAQYRRRQLKVVKGFLKSPRKQKRTRTSQLSHPSCKHNAKTKSSKKKAKATRHGPPKDGKNEGIVEEIDPEGLPRIIAHGTLANIGVISMFDGVGSVYHIIKKKLGKPPTIFIAAEIDPVLRRLVAAEIGLREDQQWGYTIEGVATIYVKDVWDLVARDSLILRQAKAMHPTIKWIVVAGSPCQDLTYAGYLNGLLGLTGLRSMLFFIVYLVILHLQKLFGTESIRYLTENAGSMQIVQTDRKPKGMQRLEQSEHFQMFLYCLGLPSKQPTSRWVWDTSPYYGIQRKRVFLRSHMDTEELASVPLTFLDEWGPLVTLNGENLPLAPLLRTRGLSNSGILKLSWTGYQPSALLWDYSFFGGRKSFMLLTQMAEGVRVPNLPWASFIPAHFLPIWKSFLITLQTDRATTSKKDELIEQLVPIFHNPNIVLPMRILTVQEVRKLAGLENILTTERHGPSLLTDKVIRDFCGNSFHPSLISAALGTDDQLQQWVEGNNDAQPYHKDLPSIQEVYSKYQDLLKLVLEQAAARGVQLRDDKVDFEAKWRHYSLNDSVESACPPVVHQPTVFAFLQGSKPPKYHGTHSEDKPPFGDKELSNIMTQTRIDWVLESSNTYENVTLSAHMLYLAVKNGLGFHSEAQEIKAKHIELLKEYTGAEQLTAIKQLFVVFQIATLSVKHQFPYGFIIWAPKIMQPPLIYVGVQRPCLLFLLLSHEPDQPFRFGTVAFDYRQSKDFLIHANMPKIFADVVQVSYHTFATYPILARIDNGQHYIHLSEFAALQCPFCALCYLHTLGAPQCLCTTPRPLALSSIYSVVWMAQAA